MSLKSVTGKDIGIDVHLLLIVIVDLYLPRAGRFIIDNRERPVGEFQNIVYRTIEHGI